MWFSEVQEVDARMEVAATVDGLTSGLINLLTNETVLKQISPSWKDFVVRHYSWNKIVQDYISLYKNIILSKAL